jgi:hypothetical protein
MTIKKALQCTWMVVLVLAVMISLTAGEDWGENYPISKKSEVTKTIPFSDPDAPKSLVIDNVIGPVSVEGTNGRDVEIVVKKMIHAKSDARIRKAEEEVRLDIKTEGGLVELYVGGPFRENNRNRHEDRRPGYVVHYGFTVKVPKHTSIDINTATDGNIEIRNIRGDFEVHHANGTITMTDINGSGTAHTANGSIKVSFTDNPTKDCSFKTINGDLELSMKPGLSADFHLKTWHGNAYSDYDYKKFQLPIQKTVEEKDWKFVYKSTQFQGVRIGKGGPAIKMDTLTGDLIITKNKN